MKVENKLIDRGVFIFVWFTIITISVALMAVFAVGLKTIFGV